MHPIFYLMAAHTQLRKKELQLGSHYLNHHRFKFHSKGHMNNYFKETAINFCQTSQNC